MVQWLQYHNPIQKPTHDDIMSLCYLMLIFKVKSISVSTLTMGLSSAGVSRQNRSKMSQHFQKIYQHFGISWPFLNHHEKCIQISTNMTGIGSLICEIDVKISEMWESKNGLFVTNHMYPNKMWHQATLAQINKWFPIKNCSIQTLKAPTPRVHTFWSPLPITEIPYNISWLVLSCRRHFLCLVYLYALSGEEITFPIPPYCLLTQNILYPTKYFTKSKYQFEPKTFFVSLFEKCWINEIVFCNFPGKVKCFSKIQCQKWILWLNFLSKNVCNDVHCINGSKVTVFNVSTP